MPNRAVLRRRAQRGQCQYLPGLADHAADLREAGKRVVIASWSEGARERLTQVLDEHGLTNVQKVAIGVRFRAANKATRRSPCSVSNPASKTRIWPSSLSRMCSETGWSSAARARERVRFPRRSLQSVAGDIVVHVDHGIARFAGLVTIEAAGAPHDCLELRYARR